MGSSGGGGMLGGVGEALFGDGGAGAAGAAAMAQQRQAQANFDIAQRGTVQGIAQFEKDIANQERNLSRQEQMVSQIDPTIIEASQQALRLLRGEQSSTLNPIQSQRAMQRQKLMDSLREQLGPGAETSTAGIQALTRFDAETSNLMAGAQQSALSQLGGIAGQFNAVRPDMLREIQGRSNFGQGATNLLFGLSQAGQGLTDTAGAQYTADAIRGQNAASFGRAVTGAAVGAMTGGIGGMIGGGFSKLGGMFSGGGASGGQAQGQGLTGVYDNMAGSGKRGYGMQT